MLNKVEKIVSYKERFLIVSNFSIRHNVLKKSSAAEASETVCLREKVKDHFSVHLSVSCSRRLFFIIINLSFYHIGFNFVQYICIGVNKVVDCRFLYEGQSTGRCVRF